MVIGIMSAMTSSSENSDDARIARSMESFDESTTTMTLLQTTINTTGLHQMSPLLIAAAEDWQRFEFFFYVLLVGSLCLFGFAANTIAMLLVRKHQSSLLRCVRVDRLTANFDILLQATVAADILLLWTVFLGHVIPSLAYVIPLLRQCEVTCTRLAAVHRPLSALTRVLVVWLSTATVACGEMIASDQIASARRRAVEPTTIAGTMSGHSTVKTKLLVTLIFLVAIVYVSPMTFDQSLRIASSASPKDGATMVTSLTDSALYRTLYINASFLLVIVVPLVGLLGLAVTLPAINKAIDGSSNESRRGSQYLVQSPLQQASGGSGLNDVIAIGAAVTTVLLLTYLPHVVLLVVRWIGVETTNSGYHEVLMYADAAGTLLMAVNSAGKLPAFCVASCQYRACLHRLCCRRHATRATSIGHAVRIYHMQKQQQQQQQQRCKRSKNDGPEMNVQSTKITLISASSERHDSSKNCDRSQRLTPNGIDRTDDVDVASMPSTM